MNLALRNAMFLKLKKFVHFYSVSVRLQHEVVQKNEEVQKNLLFSLSTLHLKFPTKRLYLHIKQIKEVINANFFKVEITMLS